MSFKNFLASLFIFTLTTTAFAASDRIVAVVNQEPITQSELNMALSSAQAQMANGQISKTNAANLKKQVLDHLIDRKLQLQLIQQAKINVKPSEVNAAIQHIANSNHISVENLYVELNKIGISRSQYQKQIQDEIALHQLQQQQIAGHITLTPGETEQLNRASPKQKMILKEKILQKKYEAELKKWLEQLRAEAYIKLYP